MAQGGSIAGHITNADGRSDLSGICVSVFTHGEKRVPASRTVRRLPTPTGCSHTSRGWPRGGYDVSFDSSGFCRTASASNYVTQWWNNEPDQSSADQVT